MAVANTLGSNVFDILIGLGVPWFLQSIISAGSPVLLHETDLLTQYIAMAASWLITLVLVWKLQLTKLVGFILLIFYVVYVLYLILHSERVISW